MKRLRQLAFLLAVVAWLRTDATPVLAASQCSSWGAEVKDNFDPLFDYGWFCWNNPDFASYMCVEGTATLLCSDACGSCGGTSWSWNCSWSRSPGPGPNDPTAQWYGCQSNYAEYFVIDCGCAYPPPPQCHQQGDSCSSGSECCNGNCVEAEGICGGGASPLLIDLENNSRQYHLTSAANGVSFDISADGHPVRMGWTRASSPVGFVTLDRNNNGVIDDGSELFGTATLLRDGRRASNGFVALADIDDNMDGKVNEADSRFSRLRLWVDANHNGISESAELVALPDVGVRAIFTQYAERRYEDRFGNKYAYEGLARVTKSGHVVERRVYDVYFSTMP